MRYVTLLFVALLIAATLPISEQPDRLLESEEIAATASNSQLDLSITDQSGIPLSGTVVTIIDGWTNLIVYGPQTMSGANEIYSSLPAGAMKIAVTHNDYASGGTIANLVEDNLSFADIVMVSLDGELNISAQPSATASLSLDGHTAILTTTLDGQGEGSLNVPTSGSGWLEIESVGNHSLTRWSGENNSEVNSTGIVNLFGEGASVNSTGTLRVEHIPSGYWNLITWTGEVNATLPKTTEGEWKFYNVEEGIRRGEPLIATNETEVNLTTLLTNETDWGLPEWSGQAWLNITEEPTSGEMFTATWDADYTIPTDFGISLLPQKATGLVNQIDRWLGNSDGVMNGMEQSVFAMLFDENMWKESNHLLLFDEQPLIGNITGTSLSISQYSTIGEGSMSWHESGNLTGLTGWGTSRMFWFPVRGDALEAIPITVNLPEGWEVRYSPQMGLLTHNHSSFTVNRSLSPTTGVWTVTVGENQPPIASAHISERAGLAIPYVRNSTLVSDCSDSSLGGELENHWELRRGEYFHAAADGMEFNFTPDALQFYAGDLLNVTLVCRDWNGATSTWWGEYYIDGEVPTGAIEFTEELRERGLVLTHDISDVDTFAVRSGAFIGGLVNATDDSGAVVQVTWSSNITEGWVQDGYMFTAQVTQGDQVNWMHMSVEERHQQRELTVYSLEMEMIDAAGNTNSTTWNMTVLDNSPPTITAEVLVDGLPIGPLNPARPGSDVSLNLTRSFDDIDDIQKTTWAIILDEEPLLFNASWDEARLFTLPQMDVGVHQLHIMAADSSGNLREVIANPAVEPPLPANVSGLEVNVTDEAIIGEAGTIAVTLLNYGASEAAATICYHSTCEEWAVPGGTSNGEGRIIVPLAVTEFEAGRIIVEVNWSDSANGASGEFTMESDIIPASQYAEVAGEIIALISLIVFVYLIWNNQKPKTNTPF